MNVITIPKSIAKDDDLVVIPRKEYEKMIIKLKAVLNDPDFGLELTDYAKKKLKRSMASKKTVSLDKVLKKYGA